VCRPPLDRSEATLLDAGFDDVLRMPFAESELLDVVARHLPPS
jgi:CheY-like chemotaxis protein